MMRAEFDTLQTTNDDVLWADYTEESMCAIMGYHDLMGTVDEFGYEFEKY